MFDQLLSLVKENAGSAIINNDAIPNDKNNEAVETATHSIADTLKSKISSGNMDEVMQLFNGNNPGSSSIAQGAQTNFIQSLMQKFGLNNSQAGGIASSLIPTVLSKFVHKTNDPNDNSFNLSSILSHFGGSGFDVNSVLGKFGLGGNSNQSGEENKESGGIMDSLKNMLGK